MIIFFRSTYDRSTERVARDHLPEIKKRFDDYPKRDDTYTSSSKGRDDGYKSRSDYKSNRGGDDYKREVEITRHSSGSYGTSSSNRIDSKYSDRPTSTSDYRSSGSSRNDDRNGSSKSSRMYDSQPEARYDRNPVPPISSNAWAPAPSFQNLNASEIWAGKQQQHESSSAAWRGNTHAIDDQRDYRFQNPDRKPAQQFIDASRTNQYLGNAAFMQNAAARNFSHNNRY